MSPSSASDSASQVSQSSKENVYEDVPPSASRSWSEFPFDGAALVSLWFTLLVLSFHQRSTAAEGSHCASGGASTLILKR